MGCVLCCDGFVVLFRVVLSLSDFRVVGIIGIVNYVVLVCFFMILNLKKIWGNLKECIKNKDN